MGRFSAVRLLAYVGLIGCLTVLSVTMQVHAKGRVTYQQKYSVYQGRTSRFNCAKHNGFINVVSAKWSPFNSRCPQVKDRLTEFRAKCQNAKICIWAPHWYKNTGNYVNFGEVCRFIGEYQRGVIQCVQPCNEADCGTGTCKALSGDAHECKCPANDVNEGDNLSGKCITSPCHGNPCGRGTCALGERNAGFTCSCDVSFKFMGGTCKPYNMCSENNGGCPRGAKCKNRPGNTPKCSCPTYMHVAADECVPTDLCQATTNGGCPTGAACVGGIGELPTCDCPKYTAHMGNKCVPVDQCTIQNGGCGQMADCHDGLGREPSCTCHQFYEKNSNNECVDSDECLVDRGGCDVNATCINKVGLPHQCACNEGYAGDGTMCLMHRSFIIPADGTLKVARHQTSDEPVIITLGKCLTLNVDLRRGHVTLSMPSRNDESKQAKAQTGDINIVALFHVGKKMTIYVFYGKGDFYEPVKYELDWDATCRVDRFSVEGGMESTPTSFYRTTNILSDVSSVLNHPPEIADDVVVLPKPIPDAASQARAAESTPTNEL